MTERFDIPALSVYNNLNLFAELALKVEGVPE